MSTMEKGQLLAEVRTPVSDPEEKFGRKTFPGLNIAPSKVPIVEWIYAGPSSAKPFVAPGLMRA